MKVTGIISEYNPFHKGHKLHIDKTKEITDSEGIVCVMSGSFMQRGIPAIIDKWNRTRMALANGVDLVIELPVLYSLSSAEFFSLGAISLLNNIGIVNNICFGSEAGNIDILMKISKILYEEPEEYRNLLQNYLSEKNAFAQSRSKALQKYIENNHDTKGDITQILNSSNNILGIEYCKSLIKLKSKIHPYTIKRLGSNYNNIELQNEFSSATSIRYYLNSGGNISNLKKHMPESVINIMKELNENNYCYTFEDKILPYIKYKIFNGYNTLSLIPDASEGLHNRIKKSIESSQSYSELIHSVKSKRYAYSRISRILCQYFVGFENYDTSRLRNLTCPYGRVLGFNENGAKILKLAKNNSNIPIYTKLPSKMNEVMNLDVQATKVYSSINTSIPYNSDFLFNPIIVSTK